MSLHGKSWTTFFSHTGSEIAKLTRKLTPSNNFPDKIVTNEPRGRDNIHPEIQDNIYVPNRPSADDYIKVIPPDSLVTLHGWMRIVPESVCDKYQIYNLHPGLITDYPELKGKDPQIKVANDTDKYDKIGCVIHRVTPELDAGEIVMSCSVTNHGYYENTITEILHDMAGKMWLEFLNNKYYDR